MFNPFPARYSSGDILYLFLVCSASIEYSSFVIGKTLSAYPYCKKHCLTTLSMFISF